MNISISITGVPALIVAITSVVVLIYNGIVWWRMYVKAGRSGVLCLIPFAGAWTRNTIGGVAGWWIFVPIIGLIFHIKALFGIAKRFGYGAGMGLLFLFLPLIPLSIIAFNSLVEYDFN
ncbi:MAG: DUF5684 domain-containing protein [Lachnospiraceae bacterium]|nr:DUF5684 domain-containing protein [Lachnospiraceae bacterium]